MAEAMLGEVAPYSRVFFPPDCNTAACVTNALYASHGQLWTVVVPKADGIADLFTASDAARLVADGAIALDWLGGGREPRVILTAMGAYQLEQVVQASQRLTDRGIAHTVVYMIEPGRFRAPRTASEEAHAASPALVQLLYPSEVAARIFVTHTRPEVILGTLQPLNTGSRTAGLGFINRGGTLDIGGMLFVNRCTWAHVVRTVARLLATDEAALLSEEERAALDGQRVPHGVVIP
jgi:phosphoketolase